MLSFYKLKFRVKSSSLPKGTSTLRPLGDAMGTPPA